MLKEFEELTLLVKQIQLPELVGAQTESLDDNKIAYQPRDNADNLILTFIQELNSLDIHILHINNSVFAPIYPLLRKNCAFKIVTHVREWIHWNGIGAKQELMIRNIEENSDAIICISNIEAEPFKNHSRVRIVPNPFDFEEITSLDLDRKKTRAQLSISGSKVIVGMMGSFQKSKGVLDFFESIRILKNKGLLHNMRFIYLGQKPPGIYHKIKFKLFSIMGKESFFMEAHQFLRKNNLLNDIIFLPNRKDIYEIIDCFDIAVRPSFSGDPWGRDIIEYMAMKKPVIATGNSEFFIKSGENGFLIKPGNPEALSEKIYQLANDQELRQRFGQRSYETVYSLANFNEYHSKIIDIYSNILK